MANSGALGTTQAFEILANGRTNGYLKGRVKIACAELDSKIDPVQLQLTDVLVEKDVVEKRLSWGLITAPDASENRPESRRFWRGDHRIGL